MPFALSMSINSTVLFCSLVVLTCDVVHAAPCGLSKEKPLARVKASGFLLTKVQQLVTNVSVGWNWHKLNIQNAFAFQNGLRYYQCATN